MDSILRPRTDRHRGGHAFTEVRTNSWAAFIGFMLSPLSWWNDLFVNVPLALAFAWLVSLFWPAVFTASFVLGYWLRNCERTARALSSRAWATVKLP